MILFALTSSILTCFYLFFLKNIYQGLNKLQTNRKNKKEINNITVIVPFRNESENIINCYESLMKQTYPKDKYEIIFIDDHSTDDGFGKLKKIVDDFSVRVLKLNNSTSGAFKKQAVNLGIKKSAGEIIVITDADCMHGNNWLKILMSYYDSGVEFISGPVEFEANNTIFGKIQKLEFAGLILSGAGLIGSGNPTICNAANISFKKQIFYEVGGYEGNMNLTSGDDEFLMQKIAKLGKHKIKFAFDKEAIVITKANDRIEGFYQQRKRWASKSIYYESKSLKLILAGIFLFFLNLLVLPFLAIFISKYFLLLFLIELLIKIIFEYKILKFGQKKLFSNIDMKFLLPAEIFHIPYIVISSIAGLFGNYSWKNRKISR